MDGIKFQGTNTFSKRGTLGPSIRGSSRFISSSILAIEGIPVGITLFFSLIFFAFPIPYLASPAQILGFCVRLAADLVSKGLDFAYMY